MSKKSSPHHPNIELFEKLISTFKDVERKGATMPYTSVNGNMFSLLSKDGTMALRLPEKERELFIKKYKTKLFESYGAVMKEYVAVPNELLKNTRELRKFFSVSVDYANSLKAKPTTRSKRASSKKKPPVKKKK